MITTAAQFKDARKLLGWTQVRLAAEAGVNWTTISYIEGGAQPVAMETVLLVQRALEAAGVQFVSGQPRAIWRPKNGAAKGPLQGVIASPNQGPMGSLSSSSSTVASGD
jgi:DNA-binding XRE family transcriptional regulator